MLRRVTMEAMTAQIDDLQRVLGYVDAVDDRTGSSELGDDLFTVPFWNPRFCQAIIRAAEAVGSFEFHDSDPVPGHEVSLAVISPRLFEAVQHDIGARVWPQLRERWPLIDYHGINDAFVIKYKTGEQEELRLHHDVAQVSASVKLNDDYEGAELEFPRQNVTNALVPVGTLLAWPSLVTHPHRSAPITNGVKYSLTIWCELPLDTH